MLCKNCFFVVFILVWSAINFSPLFGGEHQPKHTIKATTITGPIELGKTWYDFDNNNGRKIAHAFDSGYDGIHFTFMKVAFDGAERYVTYNYFDLFLNLFIGNSSIAGNQPTGFGKIVNGKDDEAVMVLHDNGARLFRDAFESGYFFSEIVSVPSGVFPGIAIHGNTVVVTFAIMSSPGVYIDTMVYSLDYMQTWQGAPINPLPSAGASPNSYLTPQINPVNPNQISFVVNYDSISSETTSGLYKVSTTDWGTTWTMELITGETHGNSYFHLSDQLNYLYTADGNFHLVFNGYGVDLSGSPVFPIVYWNESDKEFVELTNPEKGHPADTTIQAGLVSFRPGNGFGNAYPHISEGPDGDLLVTWQQWEGDSNGALRTRINSDGSEVFMTDVFFSYSGNGGQNWSYPFMAAGTPNESDVFPNIARNFLYNFTGDSIFFDAVYLHDSDPGVSLLPGGGTGSECIWYYQRIGKFLYDLIGDGIDDFPENSIDAYYLFQNYPNPFNPATVIRYRLIAFSEVELSVYNLLGQRVDTLVKEKQRAGGHEVVFNAAELESGIYFYRLSVNGFSQSRKMALIR